MGNKVIFLFGHRKNMGKDTCCDILENKLKKINVSYTRTSFAKKLKYHSAERYSLDYTKMDGQEYKLSKPSHLNGKSVRDVLLFEGQMARKIWLDVWAWSAYQEIFTSNKSVSFISDFRFPNEYNAYDKLFDLYLKSSGEIIEKPKIIKVQVWREGVKIENDGADGELPDHFEYWDENIVNEETDDWHERLVESVDNLMVKYIKGA